MASLHFRHHHRIGEHDELEVMDVAWRDRGTRHRRELEYNASIAKDASDLSLGVGEISLRHVGMIGDVDHDGGTKR
jgi:hypothetical protein